MFLFKIIIEKKCHRMFNDYFVLSLDLIKTKIRNNIQKKKCGKLLFTVVFNYINEWKDA